MTRLLQRSREYGAPRPRCGSELDAALAAHGARRSRTRSAPKGRHQAAEQACMANLIGSLRLISTFDWSEFFESVSLVEQVLQRDPAGVYGRMDFRSRDRYRHAVEELAEPTGEGQLRVALKSVERARQVAEQTPDARGAHVGYHLIGGGRRAVRAERRLAPDRQAAHPPVRSSPGDAGLPRHDRARHRGAGRGGASPTPHAHGWRGAALVVVALLTRRAGQRADDSDRCSG